MLKEKTVKVQVELPEKWVKMIEAIDHWADREGGVDGFIREAVRSNLRADIESMDSRPVADEA